VFVCLCVFGCLLFVINIIISASTMLLEGTSMSTPVVAGAAVLARQFYLEGHDLVRVFAFAFKMFISS